MVKAGDFTSFPLFVLFFNLFYNHLILLAIKTHKMLALLVRLVYNMCVSKKETKEYPVKVTKRKIEAILQKDERMKFISLWYDRSAKQWIFTGGDSVMWESSGTGIFRLDMLSVEEWVDYAYQLSGRERYV